jgi:hypothetical protein
MKLQAEVAKQESMLVEANQPVSIAVCILTISPILQKSLSIFFSAALEPLLTFTNNRKESKGRSTSGNMSRVEYLNRASPFLR